MFRAGDVDAPSRVAARCQTKYCACNKKGADRRHLKFLIHMQYLLCIMSQSAARTRETPGERMKGREYRRFEANKKYFLHRKADTAQTQPGKVPAQYDERHWREYSTMTLIAGCYQTTVEISVLGTVEGVREEYETQDGVREAQTAVAVGTTVVVAITTAPEDVVLRYRGEKGRWDVTDEAEVALLRSRFGPGTLGSKRCRI
jgi:hypothetical protein